MSALNGNDLIVIGSNDVLSAGNGNDTISAGSNDTITVGNGNDTVTAGDNSSITAGNGNDTLAVGNNSSIRAGNGNDRITIGSNDTLTIGNGNDTISAESNDTITVGNGNDTVTAGDNSSITAGNGNDTLTVGNNGSIRAGNGNEFLRAGSNSTISAGNGNDTVAVGSHSAVTLGNGNDTVFMAADDTISVGKGNHTFVFQSFETPTLAAPASLNVNAGAIVALPIAIGADGFGHDTISGFSAGKDRIQFDTSQFANFAAVIADAKQIGQDTVIAYDANDSITLKGVSLSSLQAKNFTFVNDSGANAETVTISGIPADVTLTDTSGALTVTNGSITLTPAQLAGLMLHAGSTSAVLTVIVTGGEGVTATSVSQTIALNVTQQNHAAVIGDPPIHDVTENVAVNGSGNLVAAGTISISDADQGQASFQTNVTGAQGNLGSLSLQANGSYTYSVANNAVQYLGANDSEVDTFTVTSLDGTQKQVSFTIHGTNEAPVLQDISGETETLDQTTGLTLSGVMAFSDVDLTDTHSVTITPQSSGYIGDVSSVLTDSTNSGQGTIDLSYHLTKDQFDSAFPNGELPAGYHQDYLVTVDDGHGGTSSQLVSVPLAQILSAGGGGGGGGDGGGSNHDPVIYIAPTAGDTASALVYDDVNHPNLQHVVGRLSFSDIETDQMHDVSAVGVTPGSLGTVGTLSASILRDTNGDVLASGDPDGFLGASSTGGVLKWDYQVDESKIQMLGQGDTYTDHFQLMLTDNSGGSTSQDVNITIVGQNDLPTIVSDAHTSFYFDGAWGDPSAYTVTPGPGYADGFGFFDPDLHDTHVVSAVLDVDDSTVDVPSTFEVSLTRDTHTYGMYDTYGELDWRYETQTSNIAPYLPGHEGQQREQTWDIKIDDGHGVTVVPIVFTFNSAPTIYATPYPDNPNIIENGAITSYLGPSSAWSFADNLTFTDPDPGDQHSVTWDFDRADSNVDSPFGTFSAVLVNDTGPNGAGGLVHYEYAQPALDTAALMVPAGQNIIEAFNVHVDDGHGGVTSHIVQTVIPNTNPVV